MLFYDFISSGNNFNNNFNNNLKLNEKKEETIIGNGNIPQEETINNIVFKAKSNKKVGLVKAKSNISWISG